MIFMKEKVKIAIGVTFYIIILTIALIGVIMSRANIGKTEALYENIYISYEDDRMNFEEEIYFKKDGYMSIINMPLQIKSFDNDSIKVYLDDTEILSITDPRYNGIYYRNYKEQLYLYRLQNLSDGIHKITTKYSILSKRNVVEYNDIDVINIKYTNFIPYGNINISLPKKTNYFSTSDERLTYEKQNDYNYVINAKKMTKDLKIFVDKGIISKVGILDKNYEIPKDELKNKENAKLFKNLYFSVIFLTILNLIIIYIITRIKKHKKTYYRDTDNLIDPVLAEAVIDRKINAKNLIMSVIVEQISKNNIILENDELTLIKLDDKSKIKKQIIQLFFIKEGQTITIKDISKAFKNSTTIDSIIDLFKNIKKKITKILYSSNIYDEKKKTILKFIRIVSIIFIIAVVLYFTYLLFNHKFVLSSLIVLLIIGVIVYFVFKKSYLIREFTVLSIPIIYFAIMIFGLIIVSFMPNKANFISLTEIIYMGITVLANILIVALSKKHVFTKKGLIEYEKIKGLYDYLVDYSLIKERDINSVVIWDKYLVYATAFGITSKVTDKFSEELMNVADVLNKINSIILSEE